MVVPPPLSPMRAQSTTAPVSHQKQPERTNPNVIENRQNYCNIKDPI
jgi:hypothetical protein